ncbi:precorrin-8X methylmutase [Roseibium salinum]|uniref:Precorrin-8X methylmutase n=1 Tax=Roseibium salinum TaxID=1604349 RepID=A0ABT3R591_9HYPH|nr:precorrin-8X methylmutase [Roseibium sp. DSM 29163]MCX2724220.1 precorrin-8X methylmutase [Roseibium sp. DSM 29163]
MPLSYSYEKDPAAIYRQSFSIVRSEAELSRLPEALHPVAVRLIHACGMTDLPQDLAWSDGVVEAARGAFQEGAPVFCDVEMVVHGIIRSRLPQACDVVCTLNDPSVPALAQRLGTTRSAAAVELWRERLEGAIVAIGNAPTALFHLLEMIAAGGPKPALVLGFPVGFVGAAESKDALAENPFGVPYLAVKGRRGGSAMAAAAVNALAAGLPEEA